MATIETLQRFGDLLQQGYLPSVGAWVQVDSALNLTTLLNAFNTLGNQSVEIFLFDQNGDEVGEIVQRTIDTNKALRIDLEDLVPAQSQPFEGSIWLWCKGDTNEGSIGLQAIDLDFIDRARPAGMVLGSVHLIFDFINTLGIGPYMDLVSPRILVDETPEGAPMYQNFLGIAHVPTTSFTLQGPTIEVTLTNEAGESRVASEPIALPLLGSYFGDLRQLFPDMPDFLRRAGERRGYGVVGVRETNNATAGLAGMVKVVDTVTGSLLVGHLNDRNFARPAMKD